MWVRLLPLVLQGMAILLVLVQAQLVQEVQLVVRQVVLTLVQMVPLMILGEVVGKTLEVRAVMEVDQVQREAMVQQEEMVVEVE